MKSIQVDVAAGSRDSQTDSFAAYVAGSGLRMAWLDTSLRITGVSERLAKRCQAAPSVLTGRPFTDLLHPGSRDAFRHRLEILRLGRRRRFTHIAFPAVPGDRGAAWRMVTLAVRQGRTVSSFVVVVAAETIPNRQRGTRLSPLNARVLEGVAAGASTAELASALYLSPQGVDYHISALMRRCGAQNRAGLVARAYTSGLLLPGIWPPRVAADAVRGAATT